MKTRVIPVLLLSQGKVVKTVKFKQPNYIGDPINAVRIFNDKEVDELIVLDISASRNGIDFSLLRDLAGESFMPITYGGGIQTLEDFEAVLRIGFEKISVNSLIFSNPTLVQASARRFGSQSIVASIDVKTNWRGQYLAVHPFKRRIKVPLAEHISRASRLGVGEYLITSISRDGTSLGYDINLTLEASRMVDQPLIACGGARNIDDFLSVLTLGGASAVAAGSMFLYVGNQKGILLNYPSREKLESVLP